MRKLIEYEVDTPIEPNELEEEVINRISNFSEVFLINDDYLYKLVRNKKSREFEFRRVGFPGKTGMTYVYGDNDKNLAEFLNSLITNYDNVEIYLAQDLLDVREIINYYQEKCKKY